VCARVGGKRNDTFFAYETAFSERVPIIRARIMYVVSYVPWNRSRVKCLEDTIRPRSKSMFYRSAQSRHKRIREPGRSLAHSALNRSKILPGSPINRTHIYLFTVPINSLREYRSLEKAPAWNTVNGRLSAVLYGETKRVLLVTCSARYRLKNRFAKKNSNGNYTHAATV